MHLRYSRHADRDQFAAHFHLPAQHAGVDLLTPETWAQGRSVQPVIRFDRGRSRAEVVPMSWGMSCLPESHNPAGLIYRSLTVRAEHLTDDQTMTSLTNSRQLVWLPRWRDAYLHRRCLVPATGFYPLLSSDSTRPSHRFEAADGAPLAFAALWNSCLNTTTGEQFDAFAVVLSKAGEEQEAMPLILDPADYDAWLQCDGQEPVAPVPAPPLLRVVECDPATFPIATRPERRPRQPRERTLRRHYATRRISLR